MDVVLRPLHRGARKPVLEVFTNLSERSRRLRFLGAKPRLLESDVSQLVDVGCCGREAVLAVDQETGRTVGIARFVRDVGARSRDRLRGRGRVAGPRPGHAPRGGLAALAREQGILRLRALVAHGNDPALRLVRGLGDVLVHRYEGDEIELVGRLPQAWPDTGWRSVEKGSRLKQGNGALDPDRRRARRAGRSATRRR